MLQVQIASDNSNLFLNSSPFARGGEGLLYEVLSPKQYQGFIVKIYHPEKQNTTRAQKIDYLVANPPLFAKDRTQSPVAWPLASIKSKGKFIGFLMRKVAGASLEILCTPKLPKSLGKEWKRFDFKESKALELRQKICFNLAVALQHIHSTQHYAFVDLKPDNILIQPNGLVSLVDMDSIEVNEDDNLLFAAPVATPDYTPPEYYRHLNSQWRHRESWDRFSMAVIFYKVLLGIHPFAATCGGPFEKADSLAAKIEVGLFAHHPSKVQYLSVVPALHKLFYKLAAVLQDCFMQSFAYGHEQIEVRPTAEEWCWALAGEIDQEVRNDLGYLPFNTKIAPPNLVPIPIWFNFSSLQKGLIKMAKNHGESLKLSFKRHGPINKRYFWIGKQIKEDWLELKGQLSDTLTNTLAKQNWSLQEIASFAQWIEDWKAEQKQQRQFIQSKLKDFRALSENSQIEMDGFVRNTNRKLASSIQVNHQKKRVLYVELTENTSWKNYRGKSLEAKLWHLEQWLILEQSKIKDINIKLRIEGEAILNKTMNEIEHNYYQQLNAVELQIKAQREEKQQFITENFDQVIVKSPLIQEKILEKEKLIENHATKQSILEQDYLYFLADLDKQFQQNLLSMQENTEKDLRASIRQQQWNSQQDLFIQMQKEQQDTAKEQYQLKKNSLEEELALTLMQWQLEFDILLSQQKSVMIERNYKGPLQKAMENLQQELQTQKAIIEEEYLKNRAYCQDKLTQLKKNIGVKIIAERLATKKEYEKNKSQLILLFNQYQKDTGKTTEDLQNLYQQLALDIETKKDRLQNLIALELAQIKELIYSIESSIKMSWIDTLGGEESNWITSQ